MFTIFIVALLSLVWAVLVYPTVINTTISRRRRKSIKARNDRVIDSSVEYLGNWLKNDIPPGHILRTMPNGQRFLTWGGDIGPNGGGLVVDSDAIRYILNDPYMKGDEFDLIKMGEHKGIEEWHKERENDFPWHDNSVCPCGEDTCPKKENVSEDELFKKLLEDAEKRMTSERNGQGISIGIDSCSICGYRTLWNTGEVFLCPVCNDERNHPKIVNSTSVLPAGGIRFLI